MAADGRSGERLGMSAATKRDPAVSSGWRGLSIRDRALLWAWVQGKPSRVVELHTDVPVGRLPAEADSAEDSFIREQIARLWPRRIDAMVLMKDGWHLVEVKPSADHYALGQVLCYAVWWEDLSEMPALAGTAVITDVADEDCRRAYFAFGVETWEVGDIFGSARFRRREIRYVSAPWLDD